MRRILSTIAVLLTVFTAVAQPTDTKLSASDGFKTVGEWLFENGMADSNGRLSVDSVEVHIDYNITDVYTSDVTYAAAFAPLRMKTVERYDSDCINFTVVDEKRLSRLIDSITRIAPNSIAITHFEYFPIPNDGGDNDNGDIFFVCDRMPQFQGARNSADAFREWIYGKYARKRNLGVKMALQFVVEIDGTLSNIEAIALTDAGTSELKSEITRIVSSSPAWIPGYVDDAAVRVRLMMPVEL